MMGPAPDPTVPIRGEDRGGKGFAMTDPDLHARLAALGSQLSKAEDHLKRTAPTDVGHVATNRELRARYAALTRQVETEDATAASHGHHVTDLEHSVRMWVDDLIDTKS